MPKKAQIQSQNIAPGPPTAIAEATPEIFPAPTQPPTATQTASKGDTLPAFLAFDSLSFMLPAVCLSIWPNFTNGKKPDLTVK